MICGARAFSPTGFSCFGGNMTGPMITRFKTPFDQAEKAGKECLRQAVEEQKKRKEAGRRDSYQSAKEIATYFCAKARGRVRTVGLGLYPFICETCAKQNASHEACRGCKDGSGHVQKGEETACC